MEQQNTSEANPSHSSNVSKQMEESSQNTVSSSSSRPTQQKLDVSRNVAENKEIEHESNSQDNFPTLMFGSATSFKTEFKSALYEFGSHTSIESEVNCEFNSADSTNDVDFLTRNAIQNAIELVDKGIHGVVDNEVSSSAEKCGRIDDENKITSCTSNTCASNGRNNDTLQCQRNEQEDVLYKHIDKDDTSHCQKEHASNKQADILYTDLTMEPVMNVEDESNTNYGRSDSSKNVGSGMVEGNIDVGNSEEREQKREFDEDNTIVDKKSVSGNKTENPDSLEESFGKSVNFDQSNYEVDKTSSKDYSETPPSDMDQETSVGVGAKEVEMSLPQGISSEKLAYRDLQSTSTSSNEEFFEESIDGTTLAVTLENVEVSVFEEDSTTDISHGFLESLKQGETTSVNAKHTSETKAEERTEGFKLEDAVLSSEDESEPKMELKEIIAFEDNRGAEEKSDQPKKDVDELQMNTTGTVDKTKQKKEQVKPMDIDEECEENLSNKITQDESMDIDCNKKDKQTVDLANEPACGLSDSASLENTAEKEKADDALETGNESKLENKESKIEISMESAKPEHEKVVFDSKKDNESLDSSEVSKRKPPDNSITEHFNAMRLTDLMRLVVHRNEEFKKNISSDIKELTDTEKNKNGENTSSGPKEAEVISLVDDDDDDDSNRKKKPAAAIKCVNPNCMSGEDLDKPAIFVLNYFGLKRAKDQQVCAECFGMVLEHQEKLAKMLKKGIPLFSAEFPSHKDVILLDSDEESFSEDENFLSEETMKVIRENLDGVIVESLDKYRLDHQIRESCASLYNSIEKVEEEAQEQTKRFNEVQATLDEFRKCIYQDFNQPIQEEEELHFTHCEIPPMPIVKSKFQNQLYNRDLLNRSRAQQERDSGNAVFRPFSSPQRTIATKKVNYISQSQPSYDNNQDVIPLHSELRNDPPPNLPPTGPLPRPKLNVGDFAYTMKVSYFSIWVLARVLEVIPRNTTENDLSTETYRVKLENFKKNSVRTVTGKYLAYTEPAKVQLKVGTRVIAIFKEEEDINACKTNYYVGVVAEPPKSTNKYRYLVFFDDGYTQYCPHDNILVVCSTSKSVWEDIHPEPRDFIRTYLQQYPERPMVKMSRGQVVKVEWNGRWWIVRVLEVDASLVKVHFDADKRTEWIYRGSTRLGPMYQELAAAKERQSGSLLRSRGFGGASAHKRDMPYVEYTRGDGDDKREEEKEKNEEQEEQLAVPTRSVARKSTSNKRFSESHSTITNQSKNLVEYVPPGKVTQRDIKTVCRPLQFRRHQCNPSCTEWTDYSTRAAKKYDPLIKPLMFGFLRLSMMYRSKVMIMYKAPCGRMIRSQQEMLCYLQHTESPLTIDLFDFDFWVNILNVFEEAKTFCRIADLSYGKENVPISCVNELNHSMPQYVTYMTARQPKPGVNLNLDPEFLVGCDCTDDCEDRSKCSCWQLTMQGKAYIPDGDLDPLFGYQYRRLPERIPTGIYECNSKCKCSATCLNRVAQQPLTCRLQLFMTPMKGWGIRCLHDIPRGTFICIYAGFLLTEQDANEGGKTYGDEYLAELDYIESVENLKEGYESEAREMSDIEEDEDTQNSVDIEYPEGSESDMEYEETPASKERREDIRLRLRRRAQNDFEKEPSKKSKPDDDAISISDEDADPVRKPQMFNASIVKDGGPWSKHPSVRELYGDEEYVYIMDAKTNGNIGRYLNHSCSPNVFVQNVFVDTHDLRFPWVAFFANQYISAGTELTWDYNYDIGSVPGKQMHCHCGSANCRGRLL